MFHELDNGRIHKIVSVQMLDKQLHNRSQQVVFYYVSVIKNVVDAYALPAETSRYTDGLDYVSVVKKCRFVQRNACRRILQHKKTC